MVGWSYRLVQVLPGEASWTQARGILGKRGLPRWISSKSVPQVPQLRPWGLIAMLLSMSPTQGHDGELPPGG